MEGLIKSNRFISRDEGLHLNFACALYSFIVKRVSVKEVYELVNEALLISSEFCRDTIRVDMIGMNLDMMNDYIKYMCDYVLVSLGYEKLYLTSNPFDFMDTMGLDNKDNFFENRSDAYQSAHNEDTANWVFTIEEDF
jgi:ribonucleotide reductase beta subunit family protein with ferritin-like domain